MRTDSQDIVVIHVGMSTVLHFPGSTAAVTLQRALSQVADAGGWALWDRDLVVLFRREHCLVVWSHDGMGYSYCPISSREPRWIRTRLEDAVRLSVSLLAGAAFTDASSQLVTN